ncbi:tRNA (N6-isopentenyl adenosine(37)-C2)-methylthiotransferase MiaB [Flavivirga aquatica]|uniref:tRNA-2-methylthio-N(6)-dimethylallyladenosine synthase n=1 Tax=Flavivirga aquatica TaxID=1849968 RepID=A0A1E5SJD3_9FLAO|nr:tRNA (N6-isopentenyl adenosine(37)-C2)-methylthiotransferase MiaB [Flavivirga aquatica]OEJ99222.1 tRNA (N6-isopentenyl adenosine(37)-C2)-methylthiotransferase MiaB [Flavivirga aquatica]
MEKIIDENKQGESLVLEQKKDNKRKLFIESYGCAMNFSDSEIVASIMANQGFNTTQNLEDADLVLVNTCSIRDKAEQTIRKRLEKYNAVKRDHNPKMKVGVLGCMAERLKTKFLEEEKIVDLVVGPDAYKDLPNLLAEVDEGRDAINVILSKEETYGDISPVRLNTNGVNAFVSITRGCDNMCTFCVVPFTRGRERSRDPQSILEEVNDLWQRGYKEITLLGQNVDSYLWYGGGLKKDFEKANDMQKATSIDFSKLLDLCAKAQPKMRIRFSTSNPQDLTLDVIKTMAKHQNICNHIHLPVQSGSNRILKEMNRLHTREEYMTLIDNIRDIIPNCAISQDMIVGFPTETEADFQDTFSLMEYVKYNFGYMFTYSERPGTMAERKMDDDVPEKTKKRRLQDIVDLQRVHSEIRTKEHLNTIVEVLIEKESKKSNTQWSGRTQQNIVAVFPKGDYKIGDFVNVKITGCTSATLIGEAVEYSKNNENL